MQASKFRLFTLILGVRFCLSVPPTEPLDPPGSVYQLLLPRVEWMAVRADLQLYLWRGRPCLESVAAYTADGYFVILRMNVGFHMLIPG